MVDEEVEIYYLQSDSTILEKKSFLSPETSKDSFINFKKVFYKRTFDLDFLTVPFKFRPERMTMPAQLNANVNGNFFIGFRYDQYKIKYKTTFIGSHKRQINHFGYSIGLFNGLGATAMNPWVTNDKISVEYDGVVFMKGVAVLLGIDNLNFGIAVGVDHLMDKNRKHWIYQGCPWIGLTLGLNLN